MRNAPRLLRAREEPVAVGVIGAGLFGTNLIGQVERAPGMRTVAIADVDREKARAAFAAVDAADVVEADDAAEASEAIRAGERVVLGDGADLASADVDVVVESTGVPTAAARHAYAAIAEGNHVVMVTVEAETVVGPALAELAEAAGVTYSMAYGDQPALICELVDWAETVGFDVVAAGKGVSALPEDQYGTPDDVFDRLGFPDAFVEDRDLNPRMYNSFVDGTKVAVEMGAVANATGLSPDVPGMHLPTAEIPEIVDLFRPAADGGLLSEAGAVDTVRTVAPDRSRMTHDVGSGVWIVTTTPDARAREYLARTAGAGHHVATDGAYQVFYRPHHLPGLETTVSIASAALRNEPTGVPRERVAEVVGVAKRDLEAGEELDGGGGSTVYGRLEGAAYASERDHVPFELLDGAVLDRDVGKDEVIASDDVTLPASFLASLRAIQDVR